MHNIINVFYSEYGRYISRFRAIPFNIDCLKPVERRLLLVLHQKAKTRFLKSARIVGDCIGKYHPHGDCLDSKTNVLLLNGEKKTIEELFDENKPRWILAFDKRTNKLVPAKAHSWRIGQKTNKIFKITLSNGDIIKCTSNHLFRSDTDWIAADNMSNGDIIIGGTLSNKKYKSIHFYNNKNEKIHSLVGKYQYGILKSDEVFHHINENTADNAPYNIKKLNKKEHALLHKDYLKGLEKGRISMFSEDSEIRDSIKEKNKILMTEYNKNLPLIKSINAIKKIKENGNIPTLSNYEKFRIKKEIYNLTKLSTLRKKGIYFKDLLMLVDSFKLDTEKAKGLTKKSKKIKKSGGTTIHNLFKTMAQVIKSMPKNIIIKFSWKDYEQHALNYLKLVDKNWKYNLNKVIYIDSNKIKEKFNIQTTDELINLIPTNFLLFIKNIEIEILDEKQEMFDFTVDKFHNMLISTSENNCVVAHNSSTYGALVQLVNQNFASDEGGAWGTPSIKDTSTEKVSPAAASRYTETRIEQWVEELCMEYIDYVPWVELEMEKEPLYLPSPIPIGLIGDGVISGVGFHKTVIPKYSKKDLFKRLKWLLKNKIDIENIKWDKKMVPSKYGPIITPFKNDCSVKEHNMNDFYKLLLKGEGDIVYIPNGGISTEKIKRNNRFRIIPLVKIKGQSPNATFKTLITDAKKGILEIEQPLDNYDSDNEHIDYGIIPKDKKINLTTFAQGLWGRYLIKNIKFKSIVCFENGKVDLTSIDSLIMYSYQGWIYAWETKLHKQIEQINNQIFINEICKQLKNIILNNKTINSFDDIRSKLNIKTPVKTKVLENNKWINQNTSITIDDVEKIYNTTAIKKMIEYKDKGKNLSFKFLEYKNTLDNLTDLAYEKICTYA